jgi:DNA repair ATPase RecN
MCGTKMWITAAVLVIMSATTDRAATDDSNPTPAEKLLKEKDLTIQGKWVVLEDEASVIDRYRRASKAYDALSEAYFVLGSIINRDETIRELQNAKVDYQILIDELNNQIDALPNRFNNRQMNLNSSQRPLQDQILIYRNWITTINRQLQMINAIPRTANDRRKAEIAVDQAEKAWKATAQELKDATDVVNKKYAELRKDEAVTGAIKEVNRANRTAAKLGPSDLFKSVVKQYTIPSKKKRK